MRRLYTHGKIYRGQSRFASEMLVEDGRIVAIGESLPKEGAEVVDLEGRTILPGLNDSHLHLQMFGASLETVNLTEAKSIEDVIAITKDFIAKRHLGPDAVVRGQGWNQDNFTSGEVRLLEAKDLDCISTEIPIILERVCVHIASLNTKAMSLIDHLEEREVPGGEIRRDEEGRLNGIFTENACALARSILPEAKKEDIRRHINAAIDYCLSLGITSVQSCDVMGPDYPLITEVLDEMYTKKKPRLRYDPQFNFQDLEGVKHYVKTYYRREVYDEEMYTRGSWKLFKDGSLGARTALMRKPYADDASTTGVSALSQETLEEMVAYAEGEGIRIITHAIGDGAIQSLIDAYALAKEGNPLRHGIVHNQITSKEQIEEEARRGITVHYQPIFLDYDLRIVTDRVGKTLAETSYAFKSLIDLTPELVSFGTDAPVENPNPFPCIQCAITRQTLAGYPEGGFVPEERLSVEEAIDAYTYGSAYAQGKEEIKGRLEEGYLADFIVLDRDIFTIPPEEVKEVKVLQSFVDGECVFSRNE